MPKWGVMIRRDIAYTVEAETREAAMEAAIQENFSMIEEECLDWVTCLDAYNMEDVDIAEISIEERMME